MKRSSFVLLLVLSLTVSPSCWAWSAPSSRRPTRSSIIATTTSDDSQQLQSLESSSAFVTKNNRSAALLPSSSRTVLSKSVATAAAAALLTATVVFGAPNLNFDASSSSASLNFLPPAAVAKEMASGSGSRVNKDPESLLRYGLPIKNKEVRKLQAVLEDIKLDVSSKRKTAAASGVRNAKSLLGASDVAAKMVESCREANVCTDVIAKMQNDLDPLNKAIQESMDSFQGSEQERIAQDKAYAAQAKLSYELTILQEQMVPAGYYTPVADEYSDLPQLRGRATVEMTLVKADKSTFDVDGTMFPQAKLKMIVDGYAAPVTAGNFIELVQKGFYNNMPIQRSDGFVVQTGDPDGEAVGYVAKGGKASGNGPHGERLIPLEILMKGDTAPIYATTMEDEGRGGQATVLPFSSYGALGWAREEYDPNSGSSQFFWLLFDSDLTPAGKNVLDGRYPCFGYVVEGADFLTAVKEGDIIVSAKVTNGGDKLVLP